MLQVEGKKGFPALVKKVRVGGVPVLFHGALAASAATFVGHYPWFFTVSLSTLHFAWPHVQYLCRAYSRRLDPAHVCPQVCQPSPRGNALPSITSCDATSGAIL